jgi:hypothetical protein
MRMAGKRWADLAPAQRAGIVALGTLQVSLATRAWWQLARTPADRVNGRKSLWAPVIAVNFIGPLAWFRWGRRR